MKKLRLQMNCTFKGKKWMISIGCCVLLSLLYVLIWGFSAQDGDTSGGISFHLSQVAIECINRLFSAAWAEQKRLELALWLEHPIRKLAHFGEYACVGFLFTGIWRPHLPVRKRLILLSVVWVFLSATVDEIHQIFVPDRCCSILDVLLDTLGGSFGIGILLILAYFISVCKKKQTKNAD